MSDNKEILSVSELETLCELYLDCRLTRLEEEELHYVLLNSQVHSELIDEVRGIMAMTAGIAAAEDVSASLKPAVHGPVRRMWWQRWRAVNIAASLLVLVASAAIIIYFNASNIQTDTTTYMVYLDGNRINDPDEAEAIIQADLDRADEMLQRSEAIRRAQQHKMAEIKRLHEKYQQYM